MSGNVIRGRGWEVVSTVCSGLLVLIRNDLGKPFASVLKNPHGKPHVITNTRQEIPGR